MPQKHLTIIINGATGVGKTTTSSHLSRKLNCGCISTDYVRQKLRERLTCQQCPALFRSSYEINGSPVNDSIQHVLKNYVAQAAVIIGEIGRLALESGGGYDILEGVHLNARVLSMLKDEEYMVVYLKMPGIREHRRRLRQRNRLNRAMSRKHRTYLANIRAIGRFLEYEWCNEAQNNKRVFVIDRWQEVDAILESFAGDPISPFRGRSLQSLAARQSDSSRDLCGLERQVTWQTHSQ